MVANGKSKRGNPQQIERLEKLVGPDGIKEAEKLAAEKPDVVRLAFKKIKKTWKKEGLSNSQRISFFQLIGINKDAANKWRNERLVSAGLDPKNVPAEAPPTEAEKAKIEPAAAVS